LMKGLVMEVRDGLAAVFREDGAVVKIRQSCQVGDTIELPDLPQESARNAWQSFSAGVGALGAKLSEFPSRMRQAPPAPAPGTTEIISGTAAQNPVSPVDATEIISDTVRETLDARDAAPDTVWNVPDATSAVSDTAFSNDATSAAPDTTWNASEATSTVPDTAFSNDATTTAPDTAWNVSDETATPDTTWNVSGETTAAPETVWQPIFPDDAPETTDDATPEASLSPDDVTEITSGTVYEPFDDATTVIPDVSQAPKASKKTIRFPAGLHILEAVKGKEKTGEDSAKKSKKKVWWNDSRFRGAVAAALAIVILSGSVTYNTAFACAYVSLDVDESSIEFSINRMGRVISVNAISPDAAGLAQSLESDVKNKTVDDAVSYTMDVLKDAGYLDSANGEIIASVTSNTEKRSMELTQTVAQSVEGSKQDGVKLYLMEASNGDRGAALARRVSPGRYLIQHSGQSMPPRDTDASAVTVSQTPEAPDTPEAPATPDMSAVEALTPANPAVQAGTTTQAGTTVPDSGATPAPTTDSGATTPNAASGTTPAATTDSGTTTNTPTDSGATPAPRTTTTTRTDSGSTTPRTDTGNTTSTRTPTTSNSNSNRSSNNNNSSTRSNSGTSSRNTDSGRTTAPQPVTPTPQPVTPAPAPEVPAVQPEPVTPSEPERQPEPERPTVQPEPVAQPEPEPENRPAQPEPEP
ncbi:MAG: hypothetical protein IJT31_10355, partial [Oscillibacter sp.]|nr:hypothetical protein [Oscillibacter sp.]